MRSCFGPEPAAAAIASPDMERRGESVHSVFPGGEVTDLLTAYTPGQRTLKNLVSEFRARHWPRCRQCVRPPEMEAAQPAIDNPWPHVPGSFDDVVLAPDLGHITDIDY